MVEQLVELVVARHPFFDPRDQLIVVEGREIFHPPRGWSGRRMLSR